MILSYSRMSSLLECEGIYYWSYVKELEKIQWKQEFIMGNMHHFAIYQMMIKNKNYEKTVLKAFDEEVKKLRKTFSISTDEEQKLIENKQMLIGMMRGYAKRYEKDLRIEKHVANEKDDTYDIPGLIGVKIRIKMDNIIEAKGKWYLHEMKAWKYLNPDVINNVKDSFQIAVYFWTHNYQYKIDKKKQGKPFSGIIFDAIQKPSIKKKQGESYKEFLIRLNEYYDGPDSNNKFYKEVFDKPGIPEEKIRNTMIESSRRMQELHDGRQPLCTFNKCAWCDYKELCLEGESKRTLVNYRRKKDNGTSDRKNKR